MNYLLGYYKVLTAFVKSWQDYPMRTPQTSSGNCAPGQGDSGSSSSTPEMKPTPAPLLSPFLHSLSTSDLYGIFLSPDKPSSSPSPDKCSCPGVLLPSASGQQDSTIIRESTGKASSGATPLLWCACLQAGSKAVVSSSKLTCLNGFVCPLRNLKDVFSILTGRSSKPYRVVLTRLEEKPSPSTSGTSSRTSRTKKASTRRSRRSSKRAPRRSL